MTIELSTRGAVIKTAYESEADTNALTDALKVILDNTSNTNTGDMSDAQVAAAYANIVAAASQAEMEAGTEAALRTMSPLRVAQAIAALAAGGGGGGMTALYKDANFTASADELIYSEAGLTHQLPATPNNGDKVSFWDASDNAGSNAIMVGRNGETIFGVADDFSLNMDGGRVDLMYNVDTWIYSYVVQTIQPDTTVVISENLVTPFDSNP